MFDVGLGDRIRAKGVGVVETAGWRTRGSSTYSPYGAIDHDTVGAATGAIPSLGVLMFGRTGVPGPLAQVGQSREPGIGNDLAYLIAAGRANHGGTGAWRGLSGNTRFGGLEVEHTGMFTMPNHRVETAARITAALLEAPGASWDAWWSCQHLEYATPKGRKIDISTGFETLAAREDFRRRVAYWIGRTIGQPTPQEEEVKGIIADVVLEDGSTADPEFAGAWLLVEGTEWSWIKDGGDAGFMVFTGQAVWGPGNAPLHMKRSSINRRFLKAGTDDPRTVDIDESDRFSLDTTIDLPDGRTGVRLGDVLAWDWYRSEGAFHLLNEPEAEPTPPS